MSILEKFIFYTPEECLNIIKRFEFDYLHKKVDVRKEARDYIIDNFSIDKQVIEVKRLIDSLWGLYAWKCES